MAAGDIFKRPLAAVTVVLLGDAGVPCGVRHAASRAQRPPSLPPARTRWAWTAMAVLHVCRLWRNPAWPPPWRAHSLTLTRGRCPSPPTPRCAVRSTSLHRLTAVQLAAAMSGSASQAHTVAAKSEANQFADTAATPLDFAARTVPLLAPLFSIDTRSLPTRTLAAA